MSQEYIMLKWGSLKGWGNLQDNSAAMEALRKYHADPVSMSAAMQRDTGGQKEALLELIEAVNGEIINDWDGDHYTKQQARDYVLNYGKKEPAA